MGFQCAPRERKILKLLTSRTWGKVLRVAPVNSGGEGAQGQEVEKRNKMEMQREQINQGLDDKMSYYGTEKLQEPKGSSQGD